MPSCTMAKATSGWIPTITVSAPRSRIIEATSRRVREAKESSTSSAVTSTMTPRERYRPTCCVSESRSASSSASDSADWMVAIRYCDCLRIGTAMRRARSRAGLALLGGFCDRGDLVSQNPLGLLDAALQVAHRVHLAEVDPDPDQRLRYLRRQASNNDGGAQQPRGLDGEHQVVGYARVHRRDAGDVDHHHPRPVRAYAAQQLLGELARALRVDDADDRQDQQALAHLQHRRGQLAHRLLLLA